MILQPPYLRSNVQEPESFFHFFTKISILVTNEPTSVPKMMHVMTCFSPLLRTLAPKHLYLST